MLNLPFCACRLVRNSSSSSCYNFGCFMCRQVKQILKRSWASSFTLQNEILLNIFNESGCVFHGSQKQLFIFFFLTKWIAWLSYSCEKIQSRWSQLNINVFSVSKVTQNRAIDSDRQWNWNYRNDLANDKREWHCRIENKFKSQEHRFHLWIYWHRKFNCILDNCAFAWWT